MKVRAINKTRVSKKLDNAIQNIQKNVEEEVRISTERIIQNIQFNAPVDTGNLRDSFHATYEWKGKTFTGFIESDCTYLRYVINGTGIYNINGKGRQTPWVYRDAHGNYRFTRGIRPNPFIEKSLLDEKRSLRRSIRKAVRKSFK